MDQWEVFQFTDFTFSAHMYLHLHPFCPCAKNKCFRGGQHVYTSQEVEFPDTEKMSGSPAAVQTSDDMYVGVSFIQPGFVHPWTKCFHPSWSVQLLLELMTRTLRHGSSTWMQISGMGFLLGLRYPTLVVYLITHTCPILFQILDPAVWPPAAIAKGSGGYSRAS